MTTSRRIFESRLLGERYGVIGRIAGRYVKAGYEVHDIDSREGVFVATKRGERLLIKAVWSVDRIDDSIVEDLVERAGKLNAKPVIIVYGRKPKASAIREIVESIRTKGVSFRRMRP